MNRTAASLDWPEDGTSPPPPPGALRSLAERRRITLADACQIYNLAPPPEAPPPPEQRPVGGLATGARFRFNTMTWRKIDDERGRDLRGDPPGAVRSFCYAAPEGRWWMTTALHRSLLVEPLP